MHRSHKRSKLEYPKDFKAWDPVLRYSMPRTWCQLNMLYDISSQSNSIIFVFPSLLFLLLQGCLLWNCSWVLCHARIKTSIFRSICCLLDWPAFRKGEKRAFESLEGMFTHRWSCFSPIHSCHFYIKSQGIIHLHIYTSSYIYTCMYICMYMYMHEKLARWY